MTQVRRSAGRRRRLAGQARSANLGGHPAGGDQVGRVLAAGDGSPPLKGFSVGIAGECKLLAPPGSEVQCTEIGGEGQRATTGPMLDGTEKTSAAAPQQAPPLRAASQRSTQAAKASPLGAALSRMHPGRATGG